MRFGPTKKSASTSLNRPKPTNDSGLGEKIILFSRFLKNHGFKVFSSNILDSLRGLEEIDISVKEDFYSVLRSNLVSSDMEWRLFGELFEKFWQEIEDPEEEEESESLPEESESYDEPAEEQTQDITIDREDDQGSRSGDDPAELPKYSPVSILEKKNIDQFNKDDIHIAQLIAKNMLTAFRMQSTRRLKRSKKPGNMDFRRIIKQSLKSDGLPIELFYLKKKKRLKRLVILADVSGSMSRYTGFMLPFLLGLRNVGSKAEVFVFATSIHSITPYVRRLSIDKAMERISHEVLDWSGGTKIGYSLHQFNRQNEERLLNKRTVVAIISDGWDLGGGELLEREMETISRKAYSTIWINPLAGEPEYRPVCKGMQTALPYVDYFLPANNLQNLKRVGKTLNRVMSHN